MSMDCIAVSRCVVIILAEKRNACLRTRLFACQRGYLKLPDTRSRVFKWNYPVVLSNEFADPQEVTCRGSAVAKWYASRSNHVIIGRL